VGKVPAQGDFVRINAAERTALELVRWLEDAHELLRRGGSSLPSAPICFLFSASLARNVLIGALVPSRDQVGRSFPVAAFAPLESTAAAVHFPLVPLAFNRFLEAVGALLAAVPRLMTSRIVEQLNALPLPGASEWAVAEHQRRLQLSNSAVALTGQFHQQEDADGPHYAMRTFLMACAAEKNQEPAKAKVVLDCPLGTDGALPWLELAGRILQWKTQPPSFLWTQMPAPRLLLSLGPLPPSALNYVARPEQSVAVYWPLKTSQKAAMAAAKQALSPEQRRAVEDGAVSMDALFSQLAR
jgi:type VI secretion system protein ImpM